MFGQSVALLGDIYNVRAVNDFGYDCLIEEDTCRYTFVMLTRLPSKMAVVFLMYVVVCGRTCNDHSTFHERLCDRTRKLVENSLRRRPRRRRKRVYGKFE